MNFLSVMNQVLIIYLIILLGYFAARQQVITSDVRRGLVGIVMNFAMPAMIVASFNTDLPASAIREAGFVFLFALVSFVASAVIARIAFRLYPERARPVLAFTTVFSNYGFMGFPILESLLGSIGVFYASIFSMIFNVFFWTYGEALFKGSRDPRVIRKAMLNPGTLSVLVGLLLLLSPLELPTTLARATSLVGAITTPLAMMVVGAMLAESRLRNVLHGKGIYLAVVLRLGVLPLLTWASLRALGVSETLTTACTVIIGMPASMSMAMMADKFDGDTALATRSILVTTTLSVLTVPLLVTLLF